LIHIFAFTSNRADFIELQMRSFKKYLQEDFTFTILNNSKFDRLQEYEGIETMCRKWGITTHDIEKDQDLIDRCNAIEKSCTVFNNRGSWSNPNCAGLYACCYAWEKYISLETGPICLLHPDVFLDRPIKLTDYLEKTPLCFIPQSRPNLGGNHMHDALVLADMSRLPDPDQINWWGSLVNGIATDIGGQTYFYLKAHPDLNPTLIQPWYHPDDPEVDFHPAEYEVFAIADKPIALHYFRGSNWNYRPEIYHKLKTAWLKKRLNLEEV
jgi:hypothetical protein